MGISSSLGASTLIERRRASPITRVRAVSSGPEEPMIAARQALDLDQELHGAVTFTNVRLPSKSLACSRWIFVRTTKL